MGGPDNLHPKLPFLVHARYPMAALYYTSQLGVMGSISHSIAILCTIFRLVYRSWTHHFWWEDAWAAFALIADVACWICIWIDARFSPWILAVSFTSVMWAARMSIVFSIIRITNQSGCGIHQRITYVIAGSFACMWAGLVAQKINICQFHACRMAGSVALSQLITDVIADTFLVAAPLHLWRNLRFPRRRKILIMSAFSATILITVITIPHSIILFKIQRETPLLLAHVKAALSLIICNLLVIVTFVYRVCWKETFDLDQALTTHGVFTSVVMAQITAGASVGTSFSVQEGTARDTTMVQTGGSKPNMEDASVLCVEEGSCPEAWLETLKDDG